MSYAIIGFGKIGQALAQAFARRNIDVTVASRRPPEALVPQAEAIGPNVTPKSLHDALEADTIILAVPFEEHREVASALPSWEGKIVIDAMNALVPLEELGGLLSSAFAAKSFPGARFVKGFNHLTLLWQIIIGGFCQGLVTVRASSRWRPREEIEDRVSDCRHGRLRRWSLDPFFFVPLL